MRPSPFLSRQTSDKRKALKELFDLVDTDGSGDISVDEFTALLADETLLRGTVPGRKEWLSCWLQAAL